MAHCDPQMSDQSQQVAPPPDSVVTWQDTKAAGSGVGLGCASNGQVVACSFGGNIQPGPYLKVYGSNGQVKWTSIDPITGADRLSLSAFASAPMIDASGGVIAADSQSLIRFNAQGGTVWQTSHDGGLPISPAITPDGIIVLGTNSGVISAYDSTSGQLISTVALNALEGGRLGTYVTRNSPAISGNTVFLSTEFKLLDGSDDPRRHARLFALEVPTKKGQPFVERWSYSFGARSGATPVVTDGVVVFDGDRPAPCTLRETDCDADDPHFFAVSITDGVERWRHAIPNPAAASAAADPRGGVWAFSTQETLLRHFAAEDGAETIINVGQLSGHPDLPIASAMTMSRDEAGTPVLTFAQGGPGVGLAQYLTSIVLSKTPRLRFSVLYGFGSSEWSAAQFPIVKTSTGKSRIVFPRFSTGVVAVGAP